MYSTWTQIASTVKTHCGSSKPQLFNNELNAPAALELVGVCHIGPWTWKMHFWVTKLVKWCTAGPYQPRAHFLLTWHASMTYNFHLTPHIYFSHKNRPQRPPCSRTHRADADHGASPSSRLLCHHSHACSTVQVSSSRPASSFDTWDCSAPLSRLDQACGPVHCSVVCVGSVCSWAGWALESIFYEKNRCEGLNENYMSY